MHELSNPDVFIITYPFNHTDSPRGKVGILNDGEITLDDLTPNSAYKVAVMVGQNGQPFMYFTMPIVTTSTADQLALTDQEEEGSSTEEEQHTKPFYQISASAQTIDFTWNPASLRNMADAEITITSNPTTDSKSAVTKSALIGDGRITLDGLTPSTVYAVTVKVVQRGETVSTFSEIIPTQSFAVVVTHAVKYLIWADEDEATSGSAATSVITGLAISSLVALLTLMSS
ncbi:unnamed protein product [Hydatigera taeniaeformis]|uniref:Fibronectin type-III domain-containing protein n=1 Tax=Hydatigena taeniaeformis TaxID=6205 RepID=A0A3P7HLD7_HYDTA|nr:unnamed protein product [Hydatigera taeniaeformis]